VIGEGENRESMERCDGTICLLFLAKIAYKAHSTAIVRILPTNHPNERESKRGRSPMGRKLRSRGFLPFLGTAARSSLRKRLCIAAFLGQGLATRKPGAFFSSRSLPSFAGQKLWFAATLWIQGVPPPKNI
jgi:hypothetical protein